MVAGWEVTQRKDGGISRANFPLILMNMSVPDMRSVGLADTKVGKSEIAGLDDEQPLTAGADVASQTYFWNLMLVVDFRKNRNGHLFHRSRQGETKV